MPSYLFKVSYSQGGLQGVMQEGAEHRAAFIAKMIGDLGGSLSSFHFAFGETDVYAIGDLPDDESAAAIAMAVGASGTGSTETVKLLTPAQVDAARAISTGYRAPGS
ncbi:MAG: GYD domain-containing protein [Actinomycetota bacterium]